jgi:hypothetical protein
MKGFPCCLAGRIPVGLTANNVEHTAAEGEKITSSGHGRLAERTIALEASGMMTGTKE